MTQVTETEQTAQTYVPEQYAGQQDWMAAPYRNVFPEKSQRTELQTLVAALNQNCTTLAGRMRLGSDAIVINQCNENAESEYDYNQYNIKCYHVNERGVGRSRNLALLHADREFILFSDEDIVYDEGYADKITHEFKMYPRADLMLFNVKQSKGRETYHISDYGRVHWYNYGRYPSYAIAARTKRLQESGVKFSLLFGGGAPYMNGEDSLFLHDCLEKGLRIYHVPVLIGSETQRTSTWFEGYTEKFFFDRGVLYHHLYGSMAWPFGLRFLLKGRKTMCSDIPFSRCAALLKEGIAHGSLSDADSVHPYAGTSDES